MALVVEDGSGVAGANSYVSLTWANTYHAERGNTGWTGLDAAKETALIRATDYIETRWAGQFRGTLEHTDPRQPLSFPRLGLVDAEGLEVEGIPVTLQRAVAEYALRALTASLMPDPTVDPAGVVTGVREKVGPIETETSYSASQRVPTLRAYPAADRLIGWLLVGGGQRRVYR